MAVASSFQVVTLWDMSQQATPVRFTPDSSLTKIFPLTHVLNNGFHGAMILGKPQLIVPQLVKFPDFYGN
jgi:hypothetical protein